MIRDSDGTITSVHFVSINIAREKTSGIDITANYRLQTASAGNFRFTGNYTRNARTAGHPGDPNEDMLDVSFADATLPRVKSNIGANWIACVVPACRDLSGTGRQLRQRWTPATWRFNAGCALRRQRSFPVPLTINNPLDKMPPMIRPWSNYPYYDTLGSTGARRSRCRRHRSPWTSDRIRPAAPSSAVPFRHAGERLPIRRRAFLSYAGDDESPPNFRAAAVGGFDLRGSRSKAASSMLKLSLAGSPGLNLPITTRLPMIRVGYPVRQRDR